MITLETPEDAIDFARRYILDFLTDKEFWKLRYPDANLDDPDRWILDRFMSDGISGFFSRLAFKFRAGTGDAPSSKDVAMFVESCVAALIMAAGERRSAWFMWPRDWSENP